MSIIQIDYQTLLQDIQQDTLQKRFNSKVFLVNNLATYFSLVEKLEDMADLSIHISDPSICAGEDTIPDLRPVLSIISGSEDKNILITSIGEYLRIGLSLEKSQRCLFSIISHQAHSRKRVWIPIFAAKDEFLDAVGFLDEEHYPQIVYEVDGTPGSFSATVFSKRIASTSGITSADGVREWLSLWDNRTVVSGMSFSSRYARQIKETDGVYTVDVVTEPFQYFRARVSTEGLRINQSDGSDSQWLLLATNAKRSGASLSETIERCLNLLSFDEHQVLSRWNAADDNTRWLFWLWYRSGLNSSSDYLSYAISFAKTWKDIPACVECAILGCVDNPNFDDWIAQHNRALNDLGHSHYSSEFWKSFDLIEDTRKKLKILRGKTLEDQTRIIALVSSGIKSGKSISDYKTILAEKLPDLLDYFAAPKYLQDDLKEYIKEYKRLKITDTFSREFSDSAESINIHAFDTRGQILNKIKNSRQAFFLWVDGMGIEWIDLLVRKIASESDELVDPLVYIGTAVVPTITSVNMSCADSDTVSLKLNDLDSLGHVKDRSDCNYFSIIAKQFALIGAIARDVVQIARENPNLDIVITADHGMSRHAAKGFHAIEGIKAPKIGTVFSMGRYCEFPSPDNVPELSHTLKKDSILAFRTHAHFSVSGYAPGEIHGGASPEEILVPVIHYQRERINEYIPTECSYVVDPTTTISNSGSCEIHIRTQGHVERVTVEISSKRVPAQKCGQDEWVAKIMGLTVNHTYTYQVFLNNIYTPKTESVYVKASGLSFDDDFDL